MQTSKLLVDVLLHSDPFPCFDIAHNLLAAVEVRNELDTEFSKNHIYASWLFTMVFIFSGSMTSNLLLGEPVINPLSNNKLFLATAIWFLVFFTPSNLVYNAGRSLPVRIIASAINEVYRARKIGYGITQAVQFYPHSWIIMIAIGTIRANGSGLMKILLRLMQKTQTTKDAGFMTLSFTTKISMFAAFFLILENKIVWLNSFELIHLCIALTFVYIKVTSLCDIATYQCLPFENWLYVFFGCDKSSIKESKHPNSSQEMENSKDVKKEE